MSQRSDLIDPNDLAARTVPSDCASMNEVRDGVDRLDRALIALVSERVGYMRAAARIKGSRDTVRDTARVEDVVAKVLKTAQSHNVPSELAEAVWRELIEQSIQYEFRVWDETREKT